MPEQKLDLVIDVETMNPQQIENTRKAMAELGISVDQVSDRLKAHMQTGQASTAVLEEEAKSASRTAAAMTGLAASHDETARATTAVTHGMNDMQNVLSNLLVNASMGGSAFSNLAWGLMFAPTATSVALTGAATAAYGLVQAFIQAEQQSMALADRARDLAAANNLSVQEGQALAPVLDALGIKTNDLNKATDQAIIKTGSLANFQALQADAAVAGAVATDQQTAAMLAQEDASVHLSLAWQGLQLQMGSALSPVLTNAIEGYSQLIQGMNESRQSESFLEQTGHVLAEGFRDLLPPLQLVDLANKNLAGSHEAAALAARNHAAQEAALEKQQSDALKAMDGATQAALHQREADLSLNQALSILNSASAEQTAEHRKVQESTERLKVAQDAYNKAVRDYGPASDQALKAHAALMTAQDTLTKAQDAGATSALQQQQAELQAERAVVDLSTAAVDAAEKQAELAGAHLTAAQRAQDQIDALLAVQATVAPGSPLRVFIDQYIEELQHIPGRINTVIQTTQVVTVNPNVGNPQSGLTSAEGGVFTQPTLTWVGEAGPEAIVPLQPGNTAPGASPLPSGFAGDSLAQTEYLLRQMLYVLQAMASRHQPSLGSLLTGV